MNKNILIKRRASSSGAVTPEKIRSRDSFILPFTPQTKKQSPTVRKYTFPHPRTEVRNSWNRLSTKLIPFRLICSLICRNFQRRHIWFSPPPSICLPLPLSLLSSFSFPPSPFPWSLRFILSAHYNLISISVLPGTLNRNYSAAFLLADNTPVPGPRRGAKQNEFSPNKVSVALAFQLWSA